MRRKTIRLGKVLLPVAAAAVGAALWLTPQVSGQQNSTGQPSTKKGDWPMYTADLRGSKYTPAAQIDASNFNKLEVAWRFKTDAFGTRPEYKLEGTPTVINGVLYATAGTRRSVIALDAKTGELMWSHSMREGNRAAIAPRQLSGRGLSYWTDGKGDDRVIYVTTGYRLVELNAHTGAVISGFGKDGIVDLKEGMYTGTGKQIDLETGEAGVHSTPTVVKDTIIVGSSFKEGMTVVTHDNTKGLVRAYNVRTGKLIWTFHTIPKKGEFGYDTWENGSADRNGNTGVWTQISVDEDAGLVYLPVESPTSDYYGGERPGNNLYGESLVCVDLATGQRKWYFQIVHHPIWDYDLSSWGLLADVTIDGQPRKVIALPSKEAFLYVFDRITGKPIWPIEERPVPQTDVPGEKTSPTQPFPTKPPAYARNFLKVPDDLIDFTPQLRAEAVDAISRYKVTNQMFTPGIVGDPKGFLGAINLGNASGGTNWPGAGFDEETGIVYAQAQQSAVTPISLRVPPPGFSDIRYVSGRNDQEFRVAEGPGFGSAADAPQTGRGGGRGGAGGAGRGGAPADAAGRGGAANAGRGGGGGGGLNIQGLSIVKPPYGVVSAIDLNTGNLLFKVPYGETPDNVRNNPALKGLKIPNTGQPGSVGILITKNMVITGDSQLTNTENDQSVPAELRHPRGAMLRAYDKKDGHQLGQVFMPAPQSGSPMSYTVDGKQYVVVAVSGGAYSGEYIAYALPNNN
jgi:quinoprotein glucose dehydrogenase